MESGGIIGSMFSAWPASVMAKEAAQAFYRCAAARGYEVHAPSFSMLPTRPGPNAMPNAADVCSQAAMGQAEPTAIYAACMIQAGHRASGNYVVAPDLYLHVSHPAPPSREQVFSDLADCRAQASVAVVADRSQTVLADRAAAVFVPCASAKGYQVERWIDK